jgi:hypothetical protein
MTNRTLGRRLFTKAGAAVAAPAPAMNPRRVLLKGIPASNCAWSLYSWGRPSAADLRGSFAERKRNAT